MLGTMPDYSQSKHIDLTHDCGSYETGSLLASCFTNSFGDKIIYYRLYTTKYDGGVTVSGFDTIGTALYHEGHHPSFNDMLAEAKRLAK